MLIIRRLLLRYQPIGKKIIPNDSNSFVKPKIDQIGSQMIIYDYFI